MLPREREEGYARWVLRGAEQRVRLLGAFEAQAVAEARGARARCCGAALDERRRGREAVSKRCGTVGACSGHELQIIDLPVKKGKENNKDSSGY